MSIGIKIKKVGSFEKHNKIPFNEKYFKNAAVVKPIENPFIKTAADTIIPPNRKKDEKNIITNNLKLSINEFFMQFEMVILSPNKLI